MRRIGVGMEDGLFSTLRSQQIQEREGKGLFLKTIKRFFKMFLIKSD